jgi:dihydrofolate reductase
MAFWETAEERNPSARRAIPSSALGAELAATLTAHRLIDEYHVFVVPVAIGGGKPLFADRARVDLDVLETRTFGNRVVYLRYRRA